MTSIQDRPFIQPLFPGSLDIVGDIHGEIDALRDLLKVLGYCPDGVHPAGRRLVFIGDLIDIGPNSSVVFHFVSGLVEQGLAQCILGDHEFNLLRGWKNEENRWFYEFHDDNFAGKFIQGQGLQASWRRATWAFLHSLPFALERADLRLVHAAWDAPSIETIREATETVDELCRFYFKRALWLMTNMDSGLEMEAEMEELQWQDQLTDPSASVPLLSKIGESDAYIQMHNPGCILTSGPQRVASAPFFAGGKWQMVEAIPWWDDYHDDVPVIIGHYWRWPTLAARDAYAGGEPDLFKAYKLNQWFGAKRNVFCVDFAVGARNKERASGARNQFQSRLGAVRWPERELVMDDGSRIPMTFA